MTIARSWPGAPGRECLGHGWELGAFAAGAARSPDELEASKVSWLPMSAPMPVAAVLRERGLWSLDGPVRRFDAEDWWYRCEFSLPPAGHGESWHLGFDGLAGLAELWLDGQRLGRIDNMNVAREFELPPGRHRLHLRFPALDAQLAVKRPRPRWRAPMVEHQQLRWWRTSLLGRTPGWSPPAPPIGPWRDVWLERRGPASLQAPSVQVAVADDGSGSVTLHCLPWTAAADGIAALDLELERDGRVHRVALARPQRPGAPFEGVLRLPGVALWWPHTHGEPALYTARLWLTAAGGAPQALPLPAIGFRRLALDTGDGGFRLRVNDESVFCRGACWMPLDVVALRADPGAYREAVAQVRDAGMNMLRISGATVYEAPDLFEACDAAGVMVWQDFMFANMDYPGDDPDFAASVREEADRQLAAWAPHAALAVVCGNSEVEQQAAMWGAPRALWQPPLFHEQLRAQVAARLPGQPYWPSSAHGGAFPHQGDVGTSSYYGVGAYLRPAEDARRAALRFATECLGFSNVPEPATIARMPGGAALRMHHPAWKARAPRDLGAGWDFEDVRDHYLAELFDVDPMRCRYADHDRYLALARVASGEMMARAFAEWRRPGSGCGGALVWFLRDLWAGAGWGVVDDGGLPKAAWYHLRRALQPRGVSLTDEGCNGLVAHVHNERPEPLRATLRIAVHGAGESVVASARQAVDLPGRGAGSWRLAACLDGFMDLSHAYRFGPAVARVVHVQLEAADGSLVGESFFFPEGLAIRERCDLGLTATLRASGEAAAELEVASVRGARSVHVDVDGWVLDDNHFHLAPGGRRTLRARRLRASAPLRASVTALDADRVIVLRGAA